MQDGGDSPITKETWPVGIIKFWLRHFAPPSFSPSLWCWNSPQTAAAAVSLHTQISSCSRSRTLTHARWPWPCYPLLIFKDKNRLWQAYISYSWPSGLQLYFTEQNSLLSLHRPSHPPKCANQFWCNLVWLIEPSDNYTASPGNHDMQWGFTKRKNKTEWTGSSKRALLRRFWHAVDTLWTQDWNYKHDRDNNLSIL